MLKVPEKLAVSLVSGPHSGAVGEGGDSYSSLGPRLGWGMVGEVLLEGPHILPEVVPRNPMSPWSWV